jgi:hypothetical protein
MHDKEKRCGRPRTAREIIESVHQVFEDDQKLAVRNESGRLNISTTTVCRILHLTMKKKPYLIQMLHNLLE